jgi:hypothetical protein
MQLKVKVGGMLKNNWGWGSKALTSTILCDEEAQ